MLIRLRLSFIVLAFLSACSTKSAEMIAELDRCILSCDSTAQTLGVEITKEELSELEIRSEQLNSACQSFWNQTDTLDLETARLLDAFQVAHNNAYHLSKHYHICQQSAKSQRDRMHLLKTDIEKGRGDRSAYARKVAKEKQELTKIRKHCNDIRLRFEELKQAESALASVMNSSTAQP